MNRATVKRNPTWRAEDNCDVLIRTAQTALIYLFIFWTFGSYLRQRGGDPAFVSKETVHFYYYYLLTHFVLCFQNPWKSKPEGIEHENIGVFPCHFFKERGNASSWSATITTTNINYGSTNTWHCCPECCGWPIPGNAQSPTGWGSGQPELTAECWNSMIFKDPSIPTILWFYHSDPIINKVETEL